MNNYIAKSGGFALPAIGWKYYNTIKKKAVEQEFSWPGLVISLSIAFFIVIITALALSLLYESLGSAAQPDRRLSQPEMIYRLEAGRAYPALESNYLYGELICPKKSSSYNSYLLIASALS